MRRMADRVLRSGGLLAFLVALGLAGAACKNTLTFGTGGGGSLACEANGAICPRGPAGVGDGGPAMAATLLGPRSLALDTAGNLLVAETWGNRIRRVDGQGTITTLAGMGQESYSVEPGHPGPQTMVPSPISVQYAPGGWIYWAEDATCTIYGLSPTSGNVVFVAGSGTCDSYNPGSSWGPFQVRFSFFGCAHVRVDARGNLVIPDSDALVVRYYNRGLSDVTVWGTLVPAGRVKVIAGNGSSSPYGDGGAATSAGLYYLCDALPMADGSLLVGDIAHHTVRRIDSSGTITTVAGMAYNQGGSGDGGPATSARFDSPYALAALGTSGVFVLDNNRNVRLVNLGKSQLAFGGVAVGTNSVMTIAGPSNGATDFLTGDGSSALQQRFAPDGLGAVVDKNGDLLIADRGNSVIRKVDHTTGTMSVAAGFGPGGKLSGYLTRPSAVAAAPNGTIYAAASSAFVWKIDANGGATAIAGTGVPDASGDGGPATSAGVWASSVTVDGAGVLYLADARNNRVRRIDAAGVIGTVAGNGNFGTGGSGGPAISAALGGPTGVAVDSTGNLFILCAYDESIRFVNRGTTTTTVAGVTVGPGDIAVIAGANGGGWAGDGGPALNARLLPWDDNDGEIFSGSLALDRGFLYFADTANNRIRAIDLATGIISTVAGSGDAGPLGVGMPTGVAVHGGYLYWTQRNGSYVRRMKLPFGAVETLAGDGGDGYFGDQGFAVGAELAFPGGVAVTADGTILIADGSHRIRQIHP